MALRCAACGQAHLLGDLAWRCARCGRVVDPPGFAAARRSSLGDRAGPGPARRFMATRLRGSIEIAKTHALETLVITGFVRRVVLRSTLPAPLPGAGQPRPPRAGTSRIHV